HDGTQALPQNGSGSIVPWSQRVFDITGLSTDTTTLCTAIGLRGESDKPVAWSLIGIKPGGGGMDLATVLSKGVGTKYARAFMNPGTNRFKGLAWVIASFEDDADFDYTIDEGPVTLSIVRPTFTRPVYPGPATSPGRILVRVFADGPEGLKPEGAGPRSVKGLVAADFAVDVEGDAAPIITSGYVGGEYWLVCQAPSKPADGLYDLTVTLCTSAILPPTDTEANSVLYGDFDINHVLVVDSSGSMSEPQTGTVTKLDSAKNAAKLYIDAVNDDNRIGVAWFDGNDSECDDDGHTGTSLGTATSTKRSTAKSAIDGLTAGGFTSIGDGLWRGQDLIDAAALPAEDIKSIVLLSDGDENEARFWATSIACAGDLGDPARDRFATEDTSINAIAFGPQSDQDLMQDIAAFTAGDYTYVDVSDGARTVSAMEIDLAEAYLTKLEQARDLERLFFETGSATGGVLKQIVVPVNEAGVDQGAFVLNWTQDAGAVTVELRDPSNSVIGAGQAQIYTDATHAVYHVNGTVATGNWTFNMTPTNDTEYLAALLGRQRFGTQMMTQVTQERTGCDGTNPEFGQFEQGVPVAVRAILTDSAGVIRGSDVTATVLRPDGTFACTGLVLLDDGASDDGLANDGIYAASFSDTSQAGTDDGVMNDPNNVPDPGESGSYKVFLQASGSGNLGQNFTRNATESFHVYVARATDPDMDGLPCTWESYYGTDLTLNDAAADYDGDNLDSTAEFNNGTNPFDQDTDDGGESDWSEVLNGRCPLNPNDDLLPAPQDVGVVTDTGDINADILVPLGLILRFPVHTSYQSMRIFRSDETDPTNFVQIANAPIGGVNDGTYLDAGLDDGKTYFYKFQAVGLSGAVSSVSRTVQGTAFADAKPPLGWVHLNSGALRSDQQTVLVTLNFSTGADQYRISNVPFTGTEAYLPLPGSVHQNRVLDAVAPGGELEVFVQYVNSVTGRESEVYRDAIIYDPDGDFDFDTIPNDVDPDADNDDLDDTDEIFTYHTDAFNVDSDDDGIEDGAEVSGGCTNPRNPDTDGDGILDGADPSPAADTDGDNDVDLEDYSMFQQCYTGADNGPVLAVCFCLDSDGDDDIDDVDYEAFSDTLTGP
ncbi:MAG: VWA domain-containing protein, partial [Planctomycetota bacterium]